MKPGAFVFLILFYSCNNAADKGPIARPDSPEARADSPSIAGVSSQKAPAHDSVPAKASLFDSPGGYVLSYRNDSVEQKMKLVGKKKKIMEFSLITTNTLKKISDTLNGVLTLEGSGGDETDVADDGSGFFYDNWNYTDKNSCQINFRISDSVHFIRIQDFDCAKKLKTHAPLETGGVLKRIDYHKS